MIEPEIETILQDKNTGVLLLSDGADTYALPKSFAFDGEDLYFQVVYAEDSQKMSFIETTELATFTVFTNDMNAHSVIIRGEMEAVPEDEAVHASWAFSENAVVPMLNASVSEPVEELNFDFYRLRPAEMSGRKFGDDV